jgi:hypothetical protein
MWSQKQPGAANFIGFSQAAPGSVAAGGRREAMGSRRLIQSPGGIEKVQDAAHDPIAKSDSEDERYDDGEKQKKRQQERRHTPLILQCLEPLCRSVD